MVFFVMKFQVAESPQGTEINIAQRYPKTLGIPNFSSLRTLRRRDSDLIYIIFLTKVNNFHIICTLFL